MRRGIKKSLVCTLILGMNVLSAQCIAQGPKPSEIRSRFHALLDRKRVPLSQSIKSQNNGSLITVRGTFQSDEQETVPFVIIRPTSAANKLPAVILLHGTGGSKAGMEPLAKELAQIGFLAMAIDARFHGERLPGGAHGALE